MATITLTEGGKAYPINYNLLVALAENLPEKATYNDLVSELLELGIPSITEKLIDRKHLKDAQRDALWASGNIDVRRALVQNRNFRAYLSDQQARDIIADNDVETLKSLARYSEMLYPDGNSDQADRLSGEVADSLMNFMRNHENSEVRCQLAENVDTPSKFLPPFCDSLKLGCSRFNLKGFKSDDLPFLATASRDVLKNFANNIEEISDKSLRREVGKILAANVDPEVRIELAENENAPISVLRLLLNDNEPDVVDAAKETLSVLEDLDD